MNTLDSNAVLQRLPELSIRLETGGSVRLHLPSASYLASPQTLLVLDVFARPCRYGEALEKLRSRVESQQEWTEITDCIAQLTRIGVLQNQESLTTSPQSQRGSYETGVAHVTMLNDRTRTEAFLAAIREVVRPGDVVVDVGTGTGVLAVGAAQAGARHVYAIEVSTIGRVAQDIFAANGLADRITLLRGWAKDVSLPEPADVLISELIGSEPLEEGIIEIVHDGFRRYLKPDARLIPSSVRIYGHLLTLPEQDRDDRSPTPEVLARWREWYGIDFAPLGHAMRNGLELYPHSAKPRESRGWPRLGAPLLLAEVDLAKPENLAIERTVRWQCPHEAMVHGVLVFFDLQLSPNIRLCSDPLRLETHWHNLVWMVPEGLPVRAGEQLDVTYDYWGFGTPGTIRLARV